MKLSVCMMVKNEAEMIAGALESVRIIADEVVLVDTGSTDATMDIVFNIRKQWEREGGPAIQTYFKKWHNDFSAMRNYTIDRALGNWVMIFDADERFEVAKNFSIEGFRILFSTFGSEIGAAGVQMTDWQKGKPVMTCNSARFFKKGNIRYENRVHNLPVFKGMIAFVDNMFINHFGYDLSPEKMEAKFWRTKNLLLDQLRDWPEYKQTYFYLCQLCGMHEDREESLEWGEKYITCRNELGKNFNPSVYFSMISGYHRVGNNQRAAELLDLAMVEIPDNPDILLALANHGARVADLPLMAEGARKYLHAANDYMRNPTKRAGRFFFSLRPDIFTLQIYRLFAASIKEARTAWDNLKPRLKDAPAGILEEIVRNAPVVKTESWVEELDFYPELLTKKRLDLEADIYTAFGDEVDELNQWISFLDARAKKNGNGKKSHSIEAVEQKQTIKNELAKITANRVEPCLSPLQ